MRCVGWSEEVRMKNLKIRDHFAQDGLAPLLAHKVQSAKKFKILLDLF